MNNYFYSKTYQSGISLIEALISLLILSFGLLAIASFQAKLISGSGENKTRSEAIQLAQQKLDEFRNYTNQEQLVASLKQQNVAVGETFPEYAFDDLATQPDPTLVAVTDCDFTADPQPYTTVVDNTDELPDIAGNEIAGNNAIYTRQWNYCRVSNELLYAVVEVSWSDLDGTTQTVSLDSAITWKNVTASAELSNVPADPLIPSATGRAYLGDGSVTQAQLDGGTDNEDGTTTVLKANDGADVALVDSDTKEIVLTLVDACKAQDGTCFGFVKISGRVYFDTSSGITPSTVYILASDAAYCARVFNTDGSAKTVTDVDGSGTSDYKYFDYTCYLGGGWYGNLGLLLTAGATENDRVCVGDPNATADGIDAWRRQELAKRRVYRGAVYVREDNSSDSYSLWRTATGTATIGDLINPPLYYSKGIGDSVLQPDIDPDTGVPRWAARDGGHDYLVIRAAGQADLTNCTVPLNRPDSRAWTDVDADTVIDAAEVFSDANGNGVYDLTESFVDANGNGVYDDSELGELGTLFARTPTDFVCLNDENPANDPRTYPYLDAFNGDGTVAIDSESTVYGAPLECPYDPSRPPSTRHLLIGAVTNTGSYDLAGTTINTSDGEFDCAIDPSGTTLRYICQVFEWGDGWDGMVFLKPFVGVECTETVHDYAANVVTTSPQATTFEDFSCRDLSEVAIGGTITAVGQDLAGITVTAVPDVGDSVDCNPQPAAGPGEYSYSCALFELTLLDGWSGDVVLTAPDASTLDCTPASQRYDNQSIEVTTGDFSCKGPITEHKFTGRVDGDVGVDLSATTFTVLSTTPDSTGACTVDNYDAGTNTLDYSCTVSERAAVWSGEVTINPGNGIACTPSPVVVTGVVDDSTTADPISCVVDLSGPAYLKGTITVGDTLAELTGMTVVATQTGGTAVPAPATQQCLPTTFVAAADGDTTDYACVVDELPDGTTWTVQVTYQTNKFICTGTGSGVATLVVTKTGVTPDGQNGVTFTNNIRLEKLGSQCP